MPPGDGPQRPPFDAAALQDATDDQILSWILWLLQNGWEVLTGGTTLEGGVRDFVLQTHIQQSRRWLCFWRARSHSDGKGHLSHYGCVCKSCLCLKFGRHPLYPPRRVQQR
jgi:hypothetical protein